MSESKTRNSPSTQEPTPQGATDPAGLAETLSPGLAQPGAVPSAPSDSPETLMPDPSRPTDEGAVPHALDSTATSRAVVPGYEIIGELGRGGMGVVYKARHLGLKRMVALKMILSGAYAGGEELRRFHGEAEAVARLKHPNIVQIHDVGEANGKPYFSLEFVDGGSLDKHLNGTPLPPREAARMVAVLAAAVQAAHEAGIIHRDLKPANVLLQKSSSSDHSSSAVKRSTETAKPEKAMWEQPLRPTAIHPFSSASPAESLIPKIADFGLAKNVAETGQTQSGAIVGTPSYMPPEQAAGKGKELDARADVYALGAILYECLTGRPPFRAATPMETVMQVLKEEPVPVRSLQPAVPQDLETICLKCLQKDPGRRYNTAAELTDDLGRFLRGEAVLARPISMTERAWK